MDNIRNIVPISIKLPSGGDFILIPKDAWDEMQSIDYAKKEQSFEKLLKRFRSNQDLTQKELASKCGLYECQISNFERGKKKPRKASIDKLAKILGESFKQQALAFI